jgi:hypothetical protein
VHGIKPESEIKIITKNKETNKIFICYSGDDRELRQIFEQRLKIYLASAKNKFDTVWSDIDIIVGREWNDQIQTALAQSNIGILLVSSMFLGSEYCIGNELRQMLERCKKDGYKIIPVLLRDCNFKNNAELAKLQFVKTLKNEYGVTDPGEEGLLMPFDELVDIPNPSKLHLNKYLLKVTDAIDKAIGK